MSIPKVLSASVMRRLAVQKGLVSPCCNSGVYVASEKDGDFPAHWYECDSCKQPCDPKMTLTPAAANRGTRKAYEKALSEKHPHISDKRPGRRHPPRPNGPVAPGYGMKMPRDFRRLAADHCDRACDPGANMCTACFNLAEVFAELWNKSWKDGYNTGYDVGYQQAAGDGASAANP